MSNRCLTWGEEARLRKLRKHRSDWQARRDFACFRALLTTGMRITEFLSLSAGEARTAVRMGRLYLPAERRKQQSTELTAFLTGEALEAFEDLLALRPGCAGDEPLVVSRHGSRLTPRAFQMALAEWGREAGIEGLSPHWLRHTFAVQLVSTSQANPNETLIRLANRLGQRDPRSLTHYLTQTRDDNPGSYVEQAFPGRKRKTKAQIRREFSQHQSTNPQDGS